MTDLEKALERFPEMLDLIDERDRMAWVDEVALEVFDAARRFASLTSPETIEKAAQAFQESCRNNPRVWLILSNAVVREGLEAGLRSVEEGTQ